MDFVRNLCAQGGWRRAALINTILVLLSTIFVLALLGASSSKSEGGLIGNMILFRGECKSSTRVNLLLHLALNVFSTGIISSSNFFMQILNSPSRAEVDRAHHIFRSAVTIGVPSLRNAGLVSRAKTFFWFMFLIHAIPVHLLFNSAVFETDFRGADFRLTIASEGFARGSTFFSPGVTLSSAGMLGMQHAATTDLMSMNGLGKLANITDYLNTTSQATRYLTDTARESAGWRRLQASDCLTQYMQCNPRRTLQNVVMVVASRNASYMNDTLGGWTRESVLQTLSLPQQQFWDPYVPANKTNSLWFSTECSTTSDLNLTGQSVGCWQTCWQLLGGDGPRFSGAKIASSNLQSFVIRPITPNSEAEFDYNPGFRAADASELRLQYCLAKEVAPECKVGLANSLLLPVAICLVAKTVICAMVVFWLQDDPLVTPGDAIASFLSRPDESTAESCTLDLTTWSPSESAELVDPEFAKIPWRWTSRRRRWLKVLPAELWIRTYIIIGSAILFTAIMLGLSLLRQPVDIMSLFQHDGVRGILTPYGQGYAALLRSVLLANTPQLLLSFAYFSYNTLLTQLQAEKEWNSLSGRYKPLRVTNPTGDQISTYRLQLPYRYSIPLLFMSILMHWLVSNTLYVFVIEGGYYARASAVALGSEITPSEAASSSIPGLSGQTFVGIGFSSLAILAVLIIACVLAVGPIMMSARIMKGDMVIGGTNSMVISAACHAYPKAFVTPSTATYDRYDDQLSTNNTSEVDIPITTDEKSQKVQTVVGGQTRLDEFPTEIAKRSVRWGAIDVSIQDDGVFSVGHLTFGVPEQNVKPPVVGQKYI